MNSVILSVRPKWLDLIFKFIKSIEVRKSAPKLKAPFKVYLYETKQGIGAVVGECVCFCAEKVGTMDFSSITAGSCLEISEIREYARGRSVYGWYLSNVIRYEKPKPLSAFGIDRAPQSWCYVQGGKVA